jgi:hypothetical protein
MSAPYLSLVVNCDTRSGFMDQETTAAHMFDGCRSLDFILDGVSNKQLFLRGFEFETIVYIDEHNKIPDDVLVKLREIADTVVIRKHDKRFGDIKNYEKFNDLNYLAALQMARGQYILHFDQDCAAFTQDEVSIHYLIGLLSQYDFISYPSRWSPDPVHDPSYDYRWCSTRFFICKRESLDFTEIQKCLINSDYLYSKYPASKQNPWTEHAIALISKYTGKGVFYPPMELDRYTIFCWNNYKIGVLGKLNGMTYDEVKKYISDCSGIHYPCDVTAKHI